MAVTTNTGHINGQSPLIWAISITVTINTGDVNGPINCELMSINGGVLYFDLYPYSPFSLSLELIQSHIAQKLVLH